METSNQYMILRLMTTLLYDSFQVASMMDSTAPGGVHDLIWQNLGSACAKRSCQS